jgi:hypothetical protein
MHCMSVGTSIINVIACELPHSLGVNTTPSIVLGY